MSSEDATAQALKCKEAGNAAYKSRDFQTAIAKYQEAWDLHKDITFLNNLAGETFTAHLYSVSYTDTRLSSCSRPLRSW